ncbi:MAG: sigma-70 family RNA polymerase sigma factor, partial [Chloroflexi bacterium]|nr:sigma-70 family RNA polymerase sigma factor [Chloroflexota bacterium]
MTDRPQQVSPRDASPDTQSDEQLVDRAAQGEGTALEMLYDRYKTMTYSLALRITSDPSLAEDAVQEAFLGVWRNASRYSAGRASARTWIMAITHHRAIDVLRRRRPTSELPETDMPAPAGLVMPDVWPEVAGRLDRQAIVAAMSRLSEVQR